jgi:HK97 family phage major capsid protein
LFEKEIEQLTAEHVQIMADIDTLEATVKAEKRDYNNAEVDILGEKIEQAEQKRVQIEDLKVKAHREDLIAKNRNFCNLPKKAIVNEPASVIHAAKSEMINKAWRSYIKSGDRQAYRALAQDSSDAVGGYLNAPANWSSNLIKEIDNSVFVRQLATVLPPLTGSDTQGFPVLAGDVEDPEWTTEIADINPDTALQFGKRELKPNLLTKYIAVSMKLLNISNFPVETFVQQRLSYKNAITLEKAYMVGDGVGEPLGLFTADANGIDTDREVEAVAVAYADLAETVDKVEQKYHGSCRWVFNQNVLSTLRAMQDNENRPMFAPSMAAGVPGTLLGFPYHVSPYAPDDELIFGDLSAYWIIDHSGFGLQRVDQLLALTNQVVYISRWMSDGAPVNSKAFARLIVGSAT